MIALAVIAGAIWIIAAIAVTVADVVIAGPRRAVAARERRAAWLARP